MVTDGRGDGGLNGKGGKLSRSSCTVFVMTPPNEHTSEGGRDDRGVPYHAESTLSGAQVLKKPKGGMSGEDFCSLAACSVGFVES